MYIQYNVSLSFVCKLQWSSIL